MDAATLNDAAADAVQAVLDLAPELRVIPHERPDSGVVVDFGVEAPGGVEAGLWLARVCTADLADITIVPGEAGGMPLPLVQVGTDHPIAACLASQYAGWAISAEDYFAMGSGPMRAAAGSEPIFETIGMAGPASHVVGVLESRQLPDSKVLRLIAEKTSVEPSSVALLVAPTASLAGTVQVVARSVETALHKLHELGFDVLRVVSGWGTAPLPPVARDDLAAVGRTNDAILYGGRVVLWVHGDDESLAEIGPKVPSSASEAHGATFLELFERAGRDFYKLDPLLFSPAEIVFQNVETGRSHRFGKVEDALLARSFFE